MEAYKQEFIKFMVESDVLKFGSFTLKSAAGAIHDCPADAVADLRGEVSGDVSQCCHAGASSLVMCTTVTRSSISCLVV